MNLLVQGAVQILRNAQAGPEDPHMLAQLGEGGRLIAVALRARMIERRTQAPTPTPSFLAASFGVVDVATDPSDHPSLVIDYGTASRIG